MIQRGLWFNRSLMSAHREWMYEYPFSLFITLTWQTRGEGPRTVPNWTAKDLNSYFRDIGKMTKQTFAAMGFISLGHTGHLHAHLLALEKTGSVPGPSQRILFKESWQPTQGKFNSSAFAKSVSLRKQAEVVPVSCLQGISEYIVSHKHINKAAACEHYTYGAATLERTRGKQFVESDTDWA